MKRESGVRLAGFATLGVAVFWLAGAGPIWAEPGEAPGGISQVLHVRCGRLCSGGSVGWNLKLDGAVLGGYSGGNLPLAPYQIGSHQSKLIKLLDAGHYDTELSPADRRAIVTWIDCNAPYLGGRDEYVHNP